MTINTKFGIGDTVWFIQNVRQLIPTSYMCPVCNGTGNMKVFGVKCDASIMRNQYICNNGYFHSVEWMPKVCSSKIVKVSYYIDTDNTPYITYYVDQVIGEWTSAFDESSLFSSELEALNEYKKKNGESIVL